MEVMHSAVVKYRTLKPMPGEITDEKVRDVALPLKVEAARRAIAACVDLPELLKLKDQAEGLAAAVRIMKTVGPEMIRNANCLLADAWRKGGELLSQYSNIPPTSAVKGVKGFAGAAHGASPRAKVIAEVGLRPDAASQMVRIANAPKEQVENLVQTISHMARVALNTPRVDKRPVAARPSDAYYLIMRASATYGSGRNEGLNAVARLCRWVPLDAFAQLTPDERKIVKAKITEIIELLDEMDRLCR